MRNEVSRMKSPEICRVR